MFVVDSKPHLGFTDCVYMTHGSYFYARNTPTRTAQGRQSRKATPPPRPLQRLGQHLTGPLAGSTAWDACT